MPELSDKIKGNQFFRMGRGFTTNPARMGSGTSGAGNLETGMRIVKENLTPDQLFHFNAGMFDGLGYTEVIRNDATELILRKGSGQDMKTIKKPAKR